MDAVVHYNRKEYTMAPREFTELEAFVAGADPEVLRVIRLSQRFHKAMGRLMDISKRVSENDPRREQAINRAARLAAQQYDALFALSDEQIAQCRNRLQGYLDARPRRTGEAPSHKEITRAMDAAREYAWLSMTLRRVSHHPGDCDPS